MTVWNRHMVLAAAISGLIGAGCSTTPRRTANLVPTTPRPTAPAPPSQLPSYRLPAPPDLALLSGPKFDPVLDVIERAEAAFEHGEVEYRTGHLEMAKQEFNAAIATILQSPVTAAEDKRLQKEFDSLVERIHSYEVMALQQGDGFAESGYQPAPIDDLQSLTFPEDTQSSQLLGDSQGSTTEIPLVMNAQVESSIKYFTTGRGRNTLHAALQRSGRFRDMIFRIFDEEKMPRELIALAQAESGFQARARSEKSALGIWQFIAGTGKLYGLERSWWVDDRMNPEEATRAAARHLRDLYNQFGDWYLAMAAYNCGPVCVQRAVERTGYADFWELSRRRVLPRETRNYVPIIVALMIIGGNPENYGIEDLPIDPTWTYDTVTVTSPVDLRLVAEMVDTNVENIRELNPSLLRFTTPKVPEYTLRIPLATRELFLKRVEMIPPEKRVFWRWHTVRYGESLSSIAKQFKTSVKAIAEVNNIDSSQPIWEAAELVIPVGTSQSNGVSGPLAAPGERHVVARGETLSIIARRYNVSTEQLISWNDLDSTVIRVGQRLLVAPLDGPEVKSSSAASRNGASLSASSSSASSSGATSQIVGALKPASATRRIASTANPRQTASNESSRVPSTETGRLIHRVRKGESLSIIASNYNTTVQLLQANNQHLGRVLKVGDPVYIPSLK